MTKLSSIYTFHKMKHHSLILKPIKINEKNDEFDISYEHDDLTQKSCRVRLYNNDTHTTPTVTNITMTLPASLTPTVWRRHLLSVSDIFDIIDYFPAAYIWQLALLFGIDLSGSAVKMSFAQNKDLLIGAKSIVLRKLSKIIMQKYTLVNNVIPLSGTRLARGVIHSHHVPIIPQQLVPQHIITDLVALIPLKRSIYKPLVNCGNKSYTYLDKEWLPLGIEGKHAVYCAKLVSASDFQDAFNNHTLPLSRRPYTFGNFCISTECIIFTCNPSPDNINYKKRKHNDDD